jgi:hypothetical protein
MKFRVGGVGFRRVSLQAALVGGLVCLGSGMALGQTVSIVGGNPAAMNITGATAGLPPNSITNSATSYRARAGTGRGVPPAQKITGTISPAMPFGMTLTANLAPTTGATSLGAVALTTTARDLVVNITNTSFETRTITYVISATPAAGVVTARSVTVTFTITAYP